MTSVAESDVSAAKRVRIYGAAILVIAAAAVGILIHVTLERKYLVDQATKDAERIADVLRVDADRTYRSAMAAVQAVDALLHTNVGPDVLDQAHAVVSSMQGALGADFAVRLIGPDGIVYNWPAGAIPGRVSLGDRDYVRNPLDGHQGWFVGEPGISRITGRRFLPVSRRASPNAHGVAVISTAISVDRTLGLYDAVRPGPKAAVGLFRTDGVLLVRSPFQEQLVGRVCSSNLMDAWAVQPDGVTEVVAKTDGIRRITAYRTLEGLPLMVAVGFAVDELLAAWHRQLHVYLGAFLAFSALMILFAVHMDRAVRREAGFVADLMRSRDRAEQANAAKSRFLANMSHELRTPLNAIIGFSEIIRERMFGADLNRYAAYAGDIHQSARHLLALVNDILDIARVETGRLDLQLEFVDLGDVVAEAMSVVRPTAEGRGVTMKAQIPPGTMIVADRRAVRQMLLNLLANAIQHGPAAATVEVRADAGIDHVSLHVVDRGSGVPAAVRRRLDRPLEGSRDPMTSSPGGAGLGLSIVQALARAHGGRLEFGSGTGGGRVSVVLPREALREAA